MYEKQHAELKTPALNLTGGRLDEKTCSKINGNRINNNRGIHSRMR